MKKICFLMLLFFPLGLHAQSFSAIVDAYNGYDYDGDGTLEINSLEEPLIRVEVYLRCLFFLETGMVGGGVSVHRQ
jgi:hypothetical protein